MKKNHFAHFLSTLMNTNPQQSFSSRRLRALLCWALNLMLFFQLMLPPLSPASAAAGRNTTAALRTAKRAAKSAKARTTRAAQPSPAIIAFGPRRFDRLPGAARNVTEQFTLTGAPAAGYTVRVQNGATDGSARVNGATIQLNGAVLTTALTLNVNTAALDVPATLLASNNLSVRLTGAPGSYVMLTILVSPQILSLVPTSGPASSMVMINGSGFDPSLPNRNIVKFARTGGGTTLAQVASVASNQLTVLVPPDAATGPVTVQNDGGTATSPTNFTITAGPVIADFNPKRGDINTLVTITGSNLKPGAPNPTVSFTGANNTRIPATISFATNGEVRANVPSGAITGSIQVTNSLGSVFSVAVFSVETPQDFQITLAPASATALQGGTATYIVSLTGNQPSFTQLGALSVTGLLGAITASFNPQQITSGATSTLTLVIPGNISTGGYNFTVQAKAPVNGADVTKTAAGSVNVQIATQTTLSGRVLSTKSEPIMGATVSIDGISVTIDAAGNFLLSGLAAGTDRPIMVDGRTANAPNRTYPVIAEPVTITAGQANVVPYTFYLPAIDTANEVTIVPTQTTNVTTPMAPGLMLTIPANAGLMNRDGTPVTRASLTAVEIDRTPAPLPTNVGTTIVFTAQPGGARPAPGMKMPVIYPNLGGANPGTRIELWNFNHDTVQWYIYGYGNVSADGRLIVPEPGVGLSDFSWHFPNLFGGCINCCISCPCGETKNPVELSSGLKIERTNDISFGGARGGLELTRVYTSNLAGSCDSCPFGRGMTHNYATRLTGTFTMGGAGRILYPDDTTGRLFSYSRTDPDNALVFTTIATPHQLGDVIRKLTNGTFEYRAKNGDVMRFDSSGRLTGMVDHNNNTTVLTYSGSNLTQVTDPVGRSLILQYSGSHITKVTDPLNRMWQYAYDGGNHLVTVTDPLSKTMTYGYDFLSRITSITDKRGNLAKQIIYDSNGRVSEQRFPDGGFERYSYTLSGNMVTGATVTDALGRTKSMRFNGAGQVVGTTDELGQAAEIKRDLTTNVALERTGPCGCREDKRTYDSNGNPTTVTDRLNQTTRYEYDPVFNNVTRMTDRLGRITTFTYDLRGNRTSMTNALNQMTTYGYDQFGQLTSVTDALSHTSQMEYDTKGNITARIDALGNRTTMEYDFVGRLIATNDPLGRRTTMAYDALNRMVTITDAANVTTTYEYDANGNQTKMTDALNHSWTSAYDTKNRLISRTDPLNRLTQTRYDAADEMIAFISPYSRTTIYSYDSRGLRVAMKDGLGNSVRYTYDNRRNMAALIDQRNNVTTFSYDELFRLVIKRDPLGNATSYEYDSESNVSATTDRLGRRTTVNYDALNRRQQVSYVDATVAYAYDAANRLTHIDDTQGGQLTWAYDNANRLLSEITLQSVISYTYNNANQRTSMTAADRQSVNYGYDSAGRLRTITQGAETYTYSYDILSRVMRLDRPNGVKTDYQYDQVNRLARMTHANAIAVALEDFQYSYSADDEIDSINSLASATSMPSAKSIGPANAANRIAQVGQSSYTFDAEGQTIGKSTGQGAYGFEWDARGRLIRAALPSGQAVSYGYDALGRRSSRVENGVLTNIVYDGANTILDIASNGTTIDYINGQGVDQRLRQTVAGNGKQFFLQDHLGGTTALADISGSLLERTQYEAYGENIGSLFTRYGFTGRERDAVSMLMYYRARWFDPQQGRFFSEDPIGFSSNDVNLYQYARNSPINFSDPTGLFSFCGLTCTIVSTVLCTGAGGVNFGSLIRAAACAVVFSYICGECPPPPCDSGPQPTPGTPTPPPGTPTPPPWMFNNTSPPALNWR